MALSIDYPHLAQWITYHGKMSISHKSENIIEVALSDAGGVPDDGRFYGATVDEALTMANQVLPAWLKENKNVLDSCVSGEIKSTEGEFIRVAGWPAVRNPYYVKPNPAFERDSPRSAASPSILRWASPLERQVC